jgi:hypothetical protein
MEMMTAPIPPMTLPELIERKVPLTTMTDMPITASIRDSMPILKGPKRSASRPVGIDKSMAGNAKRLISKPASA